MFRTPTICKSWGFVCALVRACVSQVACEHMRIAHTIVSRRNCGSQKSYNKLGSLCYLSLLSSYPTKSIAIVVNHGGPCSLFIWRYRDVNFLLTAHGHGLYRCYYCLERSCLSFHLCSKSMIIILYKTDDKPSETRPISSFH